jgi:hypothetical protein
MSSSMKQLTQPRTDKTFFLSHDAIGNRSLYESKVKDGELVPKSKPLAIYVNDTNKTYLGSTIKSNNIYGESDLLSNIVFPGQYYVYVLIDPRINKPFYIGKGSTNRVNEHFQLNNEGYHVGVDGAVIIEADTNTDLIDKNKYIKELITEGYSKADIARVIAREVTQDVAFAIETLVIKYHYGIKQLTNKDLGKYSYNFRDHNDRDYIASFDLPTDLKGNFIYSASTKTKEKCYVYILQHPETEEVFYVGKGTKNRIQQHFKDANSQDLSSEKLKMLKGLLENNWQPKDIGRVIAWVEQDDTAFFLESFHLRFISESSDTTNATSGHHLFRFRTKGDWQPRHGFDLPIIISPGARRVELLDLFVGSGLDQCLKEVEEEVQKLIPNYGLRFGSPCVRGAGELVIECIVDGKIPLLITTRFQRRFQIMLWPKTQDQRQWIIKHFTMLNAYPLRRSDDVFFPTVWKGNFNMIADPKEAALRVKKVVDLVTIKSLDELKTREELMELVQ